MNDTKLVKALKLHIKELGKQLITAEQQLSRATNERAMDAGKWQSVIQMTQNEIEYLTNLLQLS